MQICEKPLTDLGLQAQDNPMYLWFDKAEYIWKTWDIIDSKNKLMGFFKCSLCQLSKLTMNRRDSHGGFNEVDFKDTPSFCFLVSPSHPFCSVWQAHGDLCGGKERRMEMKRKESGGMRKRSNEYMHRQKHMCLRCILHDRCAKHNSGKASSHDPNTLAWGVGLNGKRQRNSGIISFLNGFQNRPHALICEWFGRTTTPKGIANAMSNDPGIRHRATDMPWAGEQKRTRASRTTLKRERAPKKNQASLLREWWSL